MAKSQRKQKKPVEKPAQLFQSKDFLDLIAPAAVKFNTDSYVLGGLYRCVLALRGYPAVTEELALLSHICNRAGVTLHLYARQVTAAEEDAIYHKAVNKNRLDRSSQDNLKRSVTAEANLQDVAAIIAAARQNREPLIHCAVFLELAAKTPEELRSCGMRWAPSSPGPSSVQILCSSVSGRASSPPTRWAATPWAPSLSGCSPQAPPPTCTPSTTPAAATHTGFTSAMTTTARIFCWIWTAAHRTRPIPACSSWATPARARATCSSCSSATCWRAARR